jgi:hypothetical protein
MNDAEMACCKKMAGNCDMGAGDHSCCKDTMNQAKTVPAVMRTVQAHVPAVLIVVSHLSVGSSVDGARENFRAARLATPISPPDLISILRI